MDLNVFKAACVFNTVPQAWYAVYIYLYVFEEEEGEFKDHKACEEEVVFGDNAIIGI
jgi:hypothetical protein